MHTYMDCYILLFASYMFFLQKNPSTHQKRVTKTDIDKSIPEDTIMADLCASSFAQFNKQKVIFQFFDRILKGIRHKQAQTGSFSSL